MSRPDFSGKCVDIAENHNFSQNVKKMDIFRKTRVYTVFPEKSKISAKITRLELTILQFFSKNIVWRVAHDIKMGHFPENWDNFG